MIKRDNIFKYVLGEEKQDLFGKEIVLKRQDIIVKVLIENVPREILDKIREEWKTDNDDLCFTDYGCIFYFGTSDCDGWKFIGNDKRYYSEGEQGDSDPVYPLYRIDQLIDLLKNKGYEVNIKTENCINFMITAIKDDNVYEYQGDDLWELLYRVFLNTYMK